jgi:hypothetical protein
MKKKESLSKSDHLKGVTEASRETGSPIISGRQRNLVKVIHKNIRKTVNRFFEHNDASIE